MKIAFIGLGNMGGGMAANLVKAGHSVSAFDLSAEARGSAELGRPLAPNGSDSGAGSVEMLRDRADRAPEFGIESEIRVHEVLRTLR